jgi:hypothetical protein
MGGREEEKNGERLNFPVKTCMFILCICRILAARRRGMLFTDNYSALLNNYYLNVVEFSPTATGESLLTEMSNAEEEQKIDKSGSKEVLSSKRPLWKRDLAAAWAIMDCNCQYEDIVE